MRKGEIAGVLMIRDEIAKILRQELGIDEEYQDWSYRAADRILSMPIEGWEIRYLGTKKNRPATLQEVIEGKARKV